MKRIFSLFGVMFFAINLIAVTYTKSSGNYTAAGGWSPSYPGTTISSGDVVIISGNVTLDDDIKVEGTLTINSGATLSGNKEIEEVKAGGVLNVNGTLDIKKIDKIKGTANFNGTVEVDDDMKIEDNGVLNIGSGGQFDGKKLEVKDDGKLNVNGIINLSDELKIKDDAEVDFNSGSDGTIEDIKVEDDAELDIKLGSNVIVKNDLEVKDDAKLTVGGTLTVEDDIDFKDDANITITGVINLCDDDGTEGDNDFDVESDVTFSGTGTFCACNTNNDNNVDNQSNNLNTVTFNYNCNGPLPIELSEFKAVQMDVSTNSINWITESEIDNSLFELHYSLDGKTWEVLGTRKGAGTSNSRKFYSVDHDISSLLVSRVYYRLKNVDFDGRYDFSDVVYADIKETETVTENYSGMRVFPNPVNSGSEIFVITNIKTAPVRVSLISIDGKELDIKWMKENDQTIRMIIPNVHSGIYKICVQTGDEKLFSTLQIAR